MRSYGLPLGGSPNERVGESDDDVIGSACEISSSMCAPGHDRGIAKYLNPHIVDLKAANHVHSLLEYITEDADPVTRTAIWTRASPFGRNDSLDRCSVAAYPGFRQILLDYCQR